MHAPQQEARLPKDLPSLFDLGRPSPLSMVGQPLAQADLSRAILKKQKGFHLPGAEETLAKGQNLSRPDAIPLKAKDDTRLFEFRGSPAASSDFAPEPMPRLTRTPLHQRGWTDSAKGIPAARNLRPNLIPKRKNRNNRAGKRAMVASKQLFRNSTFESVVKRTSDAKTFSLDPNHVLGIGRQS